MVELALIAVAGACLGAWYGWRKVDPEERLPTGIVDTAAMLGRGQELFLRQQRRYKQIRASLAWSLMGAIWSILAVVIVAMSLAPKS